MIAVDTRPLLSVAESHVYHHSEPPGVRIKLEKNSRGYGWEVAATAPTVEDALRLLADADQALRAAYGAAE